MIDKLAFLVALSRERHFGRAAAACNVTQPTLSAGIKQLEATLGVLLVQRSGRFGGFTPEGERVLEWARRIVGDVRAMRAEIRAGSSGLAGHLRLAVVPTATPIIAMLTTPFVAQHPGVTFTVRTASSVEVLSLLDNLEVDAGVSYVGAEKPGRLRSLPLFAESYRLLTTRQGALGARAQVDWREVGSIPLSLLTNDMQNRRIIDERLHRAGADIRPVLETNSMIVLISHVRTGRWSSILPALMAETLLAGSPDGGIASVPIRETEPAPMIGLLYPQREPLLPLTAAFVTQARRILGDGEL